MMSHRNSGSWATRLGLALVIAQLGACGPSESEKMENVRKALDSKNAQAVGASKKVYLPELEAKADNHPAEFEAQYKLAVTAVEAGSLETALSAGEKALAIKPDSNAARELVANCLQKLGRMDEAARLWTAIVASGKKHSPWVNNNLAVYYKGLGRFKEAEDQLRIAIDSGAKDVIGGEMIYFNFADLQLKQEKYAAAKGSVEAAVEIDPNARFAESFFGRIAFGQGDMKEASEHFRRAWEKEPGTWEFAYLLALSVGRSEPPDIEEARSLLERVKPLQPGDEAYMDVVLADLLVDAGRAEEGREVAVKALSNIPVFNSAHLSAAYHVLAKASKALGQDQEAKKYADKFRQTRVGASEADNEQRRRVREMDELFGDR